MGDEPTEQGPARRRPSWNLRSIVEDVAGRPIAELQDPGRPVHPYLRGKVEPGVPPPPAAGAPEEYDPVETFYPPLVGATGRSYHGPDREHHAETLDRHRPDGGLGRTPGPSHRPERLYLHYLLLHIDRLSESGLRYLLQTVQEEIDHRERERRAGARPATPAAAEPEPPAVTPPATG